MLNESTERAEVASAFPRRDSASQFQPIAAVSIAECGNLPLPFGGNDLPQLHRFPAFSIYFFVALSAKMSPNSEGFYRIGSILYDHFDGMRV